MLFRWLLFAAAFLSLLFFFSMERHFSLLIFRYARVAYAASHYAAAAIISPLPRHDATLLVAAAMRASGCR